MPGVDQPMAKDVDRPPGVDLLSQSVEEGLLGRDAVSAMGLENLGPIFWLGRLDEPEELDDVQTTIGVEVSRLCAELPYVVAAVLGEPLGDMCFEGRLVRFHEVTSSGRLRSLGSSDVNKSRSGEYR